MGAPAGYIVIIGGTSDDLSHISPKEALRRIFNHAGQIQKLAPADEKIKSHAAMIRTIAAAIPQAVEIIEGKWADALAREMSAGALVQTAEQKAQERITMETLELIGDTGFSPHGFYVYLLYGADGQARYVGQSTNIMSRVGSHMGAKWKREETATIKIIKCASESQMMRLEAILIRQILPAWNLAGLPYSVMWDRKKLRATQPVEQGELDSTG